MDDAKGQDSHFDSWLTQNEGICKAIDALKILDTPPAAAQPAQDATMQSLKDLKRSVCDEVGKAAFAQPAQEPFEYDKHLEKK
jgi:hypothetical protein